LNKKIFTKLETCFNDCVDIEDLINLIQNLEDKIILFGIGLLFSVHFFINTFMVSGFIPATGVPIPFLSYGRSFFLLNLLCMNFIFVIIYKNQKK
jgi:rod shape determining protein RodA